MRSPVICRLSRSDLGNKLDFCVCTSLYSYQVCHTEFDTVSDVETVEECELVTRRHCTELHQQVVSPLHADEVTIPEPIFRSNEAMRPQQPYVQDIFSAVPKCHDNQVIAN